MARRAKEYRDAGKIRQAPVSPMGQLHLRALLLIGVLLALLLAVTTALTASNNGRLNAILKESVKAELLAICFAAREDIDVELFLAINSEQDIWDNQERYDAMIDRLRELKNAVGATYIYTLKEIDGAYYFVFDTDELAGTPENPIVTAYELSPVHEAAFAGLSAADVMNVADEWGTYNTGAIPLYHEGQIIGIISTDVTDSYIERGRQTAIFSIT
ncbi:MAG: hypothetical protein LBH64_04150, partial [Coriobacteriales bacterium]|nr:hypothetical protein [Coriobacteriales bacterium]